MQKRNGAYFFHKHVLKLNVRYSSAENSLRNVGLCHKMSYCAT